MRKLSIIIGMIALGVSSCSKLASRNLTDQEKEDLTFLVQEEKLAHDVYTYAYNKYGEAIFQNIASSEQSHMNSVSRLIDKYGLDNPVDGLAFGEFDNQELQSLYVQLTATVDSSLIHAYKVGATIEDLDIDDIEDLTEHTQNSDLSNVYDKLSCGSTNHIRGFVGSLEAQNETYTPQFISQDDFEVYMASSNQQCGRQ